MTTQFMFKIDPKLKKAAMKKAKEQGITFSAFLVFATKAFIEGRLDIGLINREELKLRTSPPDEGCTSVRNICKKPRPVYYPNIPNRGTTPVRRQKTT